MPDRTLHVLLIEDSPTDALLVQEALAEAATPFVVTTVERLSEGLGRLTETHFDAVLLDLGLPDSQGLETFVKVHSQAPGVSCLVLTHLADDTLAVKAVRAGAQDYLVKSQMRGELLSPTIRHAVERKRAEVALRESEAMFQALFEFAPDAIVAVNREGNIVRVNTQAETMFGYRREELHGQPIEMLLPERFTQRHVGHRAGYMANPRTRPMGAGLELYGRRKDGSEFPVDITLGPLGTGESSIVLSIVRDITDRKRAELRIRTQLEHMGLLDQITRAISERLDLRSIFKVVVGRLEDSLPIDFGCVCLYDEPARALRFAVTDAKSAALATELALTGPDAIIDVDDNGLGRCVQGQLVYEPDIRQAAFPFPQRLARGGLCSLVMAPLCSESGVFGLLVAARREAHSFSSVECEFLRQLGDHVALAIGHAELYNALQSAYDDLRQSQQATLQQERLRALGQMASGIAHDINNAISPIMLYTETMLEKEPNLSAKGRENLITIRQAAEDVAQTVSRMREFYREREPQLDLTAVDLNHVAEQAAKLTRARWYDMAQQRGVVIELRKDLASGLPAIMGVESEIREALTNLVFNAVDAMPEGGTLTLRTRVVEKQPEAGAAEHMPLAVVEVIDTGIGMDEETRRRCLEPFYTTKGERGTGLGLAMVYGIVQRHSAELQIESVPGKGTTVRLVFAVPTGVVAEATESGDKIMPSRLRLLIVDDDPLLLTSLRDSLEGDGHEVTVAAGGQEGIDVFRAALEHNEPFAAVITDLGMPYVDGRKVAVAVKKSSPATPVILLTGWGQRLVTENDIPPHVDRVLAKPPRMRELREALARCCGHEPDALTS